jgi:uncharacterized protein YjlB
MPTTANRRFEHSSAKRPERFFIANRCHEGSQALDFAEIDLQMISAAVHCTIHNSYQRIDVVALYAGGFLFYVQDDDDFHAAWEREKSRRAPNPCLEPH